MKNNYFTLSGSKIKTIFKIALILLTFNSSIAYSQNWQWAASGNGGADDYAHDNCTDPSGNVIVAGQFDSSPLQMGTVTLNNAGAAGTYDAFVTKYGPNGNVLWAQKIGGTGGESITGVCTDAAGNIYVSGSFSTYFLTVGALSVTNFTNSGTSDIFVACYSPAGVIQWLKSFGGTKNEQSTDCVFSNSLSCLYVNGYFYSTSVTAGTNTITNSDATGANTDIFLARFTSTGSVTWLKSTGASTSNDNPGQMAIDSNSDPYFCGQFAPTSGVTTTIGSTILTTYGGEDMLLAKYNSSGVAQWAKNFGSTTNCTCDFIGGMSIDAANNIFVSGTYSGASLIAGTFTVTNSGNYDCFAAKTNSLGVFQWVTKVGGAGDQYAYGMANDNVGNVFLTGAFSNTVVVGTTTLSNPTPGFSYDIYVLKFNNSGVAQWANSAVGLNADEWGYSISCDPSGNAYVSGTIYTSPTAFGTTTLNNTGATDFFIAKIGCLTATVSGISSICAGSSATLTAGGATSYTWNTGATTSSIVITPTSSATYSVLGATGTCTGASIPYSVTLLPAGINTGSNLNLLCNQSQAINVTTNPSATLVAWSPTTGLTASNTLSPTVSATASPTQYSVSATLNNGCAVAGIVSVTRYAPKPDICLVSVDSLGMNNEIFWEKTLYANVDSFIVYREVTANVYKRIAAISNTNFSGYTDTSRSVGPANGDPNFTSYKYKLQIRDVCGNYSAMSFWHQTLFIQDQQNGNFNWNSYAIESSGTPVSLYDLYRVDLATNTYSLITSTTANLATDPSYSTWQTTAKWRVQANGFTCNPTPRLASPTVLKIKTKSNIKNDRLVAPSGIQSYSILNNAVNVYPTPASDEIYINAKSLSNTDFEIELQNALGQIVFTKKYTASSTETYQIETASFANGIYFINVKQQNKTVAVKKVVISK